jgi:hypothetical protein
MDDQQQDFINSENKKTTFLHRKNFDLQIETSPLQSQAAIPQEQMRAPTSARTVFRASNTELELEGRPSISPLLGRPSISPLLGRPSISPLTRDFNPKIHSWLGESIIISILSCCCLCPLPISLVAVYMSSKVDALVLRHEYKEAERMARLSKILALIGLAILIAAYLTAFIIAMQLLRPL